MKPKYFLPVIASVTLLAPGAAQADSLEEGLGGAAARLEELVPGKLNLDYRIRWELFELDDGSPNRDGFSHRLRYGYRTPDLHGFTAMAEGESLWAISDDEEIHPLDEAGTGTDLNQLWLDYSNQDAGSIKLGRQLYVLDDQRFIGHVGWRQNIQTFDALTGALTAVDRFRLDAFYFEAVNRVNGAHDEFDGTWGLNASYVFGDQLKLVGFYYRMEVDSGQTLGLAVNSDTIGARISGELDVREHLTLRYFASYAFQSDGDRHPASFDLSYVAGDIGATFHRFTLGAGVEFLEGDGASGFSTPVATVHKFNGYADVFLPIASTSIPSGLNDYYVYAGYKVPLGEYGVVPIKVVYHRFDANDVSADYGQELDIVASYAVNKYMRLIAKFGRYNTDSAGSGLGAGGFDKTFGSFELNFVY
jgi:hypothetical protein